jgi:hypothetical protein
MDDNLEIVEKIYKERDYKETDYKIYTCGCNNKLIKSFKEHVKHISMKKHHKYIIEKNKNMPLYVLYDEIKEKITEMSSKSFDELLKEYIDIRFSVGENDASDCKYYRFDESENKWKLENLDFFFNAITGDDDNVISMFDILFTDEFSFFYFEEFNPEYYKKFDKDHTYTYNIHKEYYDKYEDAEKSKMYKMLLEALCIYYYIIHLGNINPNH